MNNEERTEYLAIRSGLHEKSHVYTRCPACKTLRFLKNMIDARSCDFCIQERLKERKPYGMS